MLTFSRIIVVITCSIIFFKHITHVNISTSRHSSPYNVPDMSNRRASPQIESDSTALQISSGSKLIDKPVKEFTNTKIYSITNIIHPKATSYKTSYTTVTYDRTYYVTVPVTSFRTNLGSSVTTRTHSSPPPKKTYNPKTKKTPSEVANEKNFIWFTIPYTELRIFLYIFVPYDECVATEFDIFCEPASQETVDRYLRHAYYILIFLFLFYQATIYFTIYDTVLFVKYIFNLILYS
ncbi:hypothetical protein J3Q64DRAFT_1881995 [Phycomyces blakesleeanus]|uniref:Uncharacterized protein n=1 Tax=Phycomyces blakesleeanus TaxID=4837 RepID=A0ABR3B2Z3_PHYBL